MGEVTFDEDQGFGEIPQPKIEPRTFGEDLMHIGIIRTPGEAMILFAVAAFLLISLSIYMLASSVQEPKTLQDSRGNTTQDN